MKLNLKHVDVLTIWVPRPQTDGKAPIMVCHSPLNASLRDETVFFAKETQISLGEKGGIFTGLFEVFPTGSRQIDWRMVGENLALNFLVLMKDS